ncbi:MAG: SMC-Scp complex subunit ScpB [Thermodesulfobacteriota bacterium]|nr:SMC-Scp complex subunit ScpB [Thermodesulfobacteriota bacterium]
MDDLKNILESLLFVADEPLNVERFKKIIPQTDTHQIRQTMVDLAAEYDTRKTSFYLSEVAGGYQLRTRPAYTEWIRRLVQPKPARLSRAALETLAIIAYKQPVLRADIEHIRGVDSGGVLRLLMERNLIRILGRKEIPGRPLIYATTKLFLEVFGLKDLKDLPTPLEIESLGSGEDVAIEPQDTQKAQSDESPALNPADTSDSQPEPASIIEPMENKDGPQDSSADSPVEKDLDAAISEDYKSNEHSETGG